MRRLITKVLALVMSALLLISGSAIGASAAEERSIAFPQGSSSVSIYMDGRQVLAGRSALINSVTYVSLRDFCDIVGGCSVTWDAKTRTAVVTKGTKVATLTDGDYYVYEDGRCFYTVERTPCPQRSAVGSEPSTSYTLSRFGIGRSYRL